MCPPLSSPAILLIFTALRLPGKDFIVTNALLWTLSGTGFTWLMTVLGASVVLFSRRKGSQTIHRLMLGFAAGVMIASSMWSLLIPAIEAAQASGLPGWLPAAGGFACGIAFLMGMDAVLPQLMPGSPKQDATHHARRRAILLALAITLHNIPEGMAVGVSFAQAAGDAPSHLPAAFSLAFGVGIQNFPEGAAIALPLFQEGMSRKRAFCIGALSGVVEPLFGLLTVLLVGTVQNLLPWLLSFAAGSMLYVVVEELIPEANLRHDHKARSGTLGFMGGFLMMMILDVALG